MKIAVRYDEYGLPTAITIGGWDVLHVRDSTRTLATLDAIVRALQLAPESVIEKILEIAIKESRRYEQNRIESSSH
jgi:hypothetical protein